MFSKFRQELRLPKLELLRPDRAIHLKLEHAAANPERTAMGRDLGAHNLSPLLTNSVSERDALQSEIPEHLPDKIPDGLKAPLAPWPSPARTKTHPREPPPGAR